MLTLCRSLPLILNLTDFLVAALVGVESIFDLPLVIIIGGFFSGDYRERGERGEAGEGGEAVDITRDFSWVAWEWDTTLAEGEKLLAWSFIAEIWMTLFEVWGSSSFGGEAGMCLFK